MIMQVDVVIISCNQAVGHGARLPFDTHVRVMIWHFPIIICASRSEMPTVARALSRGDSSQAAKTARGRMVVYFLKSN